MSKYEKLKTKALNGSELSFDEFKNLLSNSGFEFARQKGSHEIWHLNKLEIMVIQSEKGKAKQYQVKQFINIMGYKNER